MDSGWTTLLIFAGATLALWLVLIIAMWIYRPDRTTLQSALAIFPDFLKLIRIVVTDTSLPRRVRWPIWGLLAYLAMPIDLVPDVIPIIGLADDVIVALWVVRSALARIEPSKLAQLWPGSPAGFVAMRKVFRLPDSPTD